MSDAAIANIVTGFVTITMMVTGFFTLWVKLRYSVEEAEKAVTRASVASEKADRSHEIIAEIKDLAVKTETQTNNRLSVLDAKVATHEIKCIESARLSADQARQIAELKLALAEERAKHK